MPAVWGYPESRTRIALLDILAFLRCISGDLDEMQEGSNWSCNHKGQRCSFVCMVWPEVTRNPSQEGRAIHWVLLRVMQDPMSPESGWWLGSPPHHICPERCYLGLQLGKG